MSNVAAYLAKEALKDGNEVTIRAMRPDDKERLVKAFLHLQPQTIRMRFFSMVKTLARDSLIRLCHLDYDREMALAAVEREGDRSRILGVSRYYLNVETGDAEFAVVVGDEWQGQGLGYHLMERLIAVARQRSVKRLIGVEYTARQRHFECARHAHNAGAGGSAL